MLRSCEWLVSKVGGGGEDMGNWSQVGVNWSHF